MLTAKCEEAVFSTKQTKMKQIRPHVIRRRCPHLPHLHEALSSSASPKNQQGLLTTGS